MTDPGMILLTLHAFHQKLIIFKHSQLFFLLSKQASLPGHSREVKTVAEHLQPKESLSNFDTEKKKSVAKCKMDLLSEMKYNFSQIVKLLHFLY